MDEEASHHEINSNRSQENQNHESQLSKSSFETLNLSQLVRDRNNELKIAKNIMPNGNIFFLLWKVLSITSRLVFRIRREMILSMI